MAWTTPATWTTNQLVSASDLNAQIRDNMSFLFNGQSVSSVVRNGTYSTTSNSFVDVDAVNLILTLTVTTGRVLIVAYGQAACSNTASAYTDVDIILDSLTRAGNTTGLFNIPPNTTLPFVAGALFTGLSAGSHTFKLQYRNRVAGGTSYLGLDAAGRVYNTIMLGVEV